MPLYKLNDKSPSLPEEGEVFIAPSADLIGDVRLQTGASIWFGAVLRGDNDPIYIGKNANIQDLSVIHTDPGLPTRVGANVTVGHRVILHSCEIGENSLIGMGTTILNRAKIGKNCLVGANSLITEGKEFPDGSLIVGSPAKIVKTLDKDTIARLQMSSKIYTANGDRYRQELELLNE